MLNRVLPYQLDETGLNYLHKAVQTDDHSGTEDEVIAAIYDDRYRLFQWETETENLILITSISTQRDGYREFVVNMIAGHGAQSGQHEILEAVRKQAAEYNCNRVIAFVKPHIAEIFGVASFKKDTTNKNLMTAFDNYYLVVGVEV